MQIAKRRLNTFANCNPPFLALDPRLPPPSALNVSAFLNLSHRPRHLACLKRLNMKPAKPGTAVRILFIILLLSTNALAMDRWTALAMLESGGDDHIVGPAGEISRYQIRPELWPGGNPQDPGIALTNAQHIMSPRLAAFAQTHRRAADDFEFYILWNAPAQINHPRPAVTDRARRFANLVGSTKPRS